jgi:hypothetical protein
MPPIYHHKTNPTKGLPLQKMYSHNKTIIFHTTMIFYPTVAVTKPTKNSDLKLSPKPDFPLFAPLAKTSLNK